MTKITAYNTLGTKENRVVATYTVEATGREALNEASYLAAQWNKTETRKNMLVNFVVADGMVRPV